MSSECESMQEEPCQTPQPPTAPQGCPGETQPAMAPQGCPPGETQPQGYPPGETQPQGCPPGETQPQGCPPGETQPATAPQGCPPGETQAQTLPPKLWVSLQGQELDNVTTQFDRLQRVGAEREEESKGRESFLVQLQSLEKDGERGVCYIQREAIAMYPKLKKKLDDEQKEDDSLATMKLECCKSALKHIAVYLMAKLKYPKKSYLAPEEKDLEVVMDVLHVATLYNI